MVLDYLLYKHVSTFLLITKNGQNESFWNRIII